MAAAKLENTYQREKRIQRNEKIRSLLTELPPAVTDFIRSMTANTSALTRLSYLYDLRLFFRYLRLEDRRFADVPVTAITPALLADLSLRDFDLYKEYLREYVRKDDNGDDLTDRVGQAVIVENREVGIARKLSAVRSFYKYLFLNGLIHDNPAAGITMPKLHQKPVIYLDREEISRMFDVVTTGEGLSDRQKAYNEHFRTRDIAIVALLLGTGIRESELIGLDLDDVDPEHHSFQVTRKGGNEAILYFNDQVRDALCDYLRVRRETEALPGHEQAFFLSSQRKRLSPRALQNMIKKYAAVAAPLKKRISPHKMRSTFATNLYRRTRDIYLVSESLGHSQLQTSLRYTAKDEAMREKAARSVDWVEPSPDQSEE